MTNCDRFLAVSMRGLVGLLLSLVILPTIAASEAAADSASIRLRAGDTLRLRIYDHPDLDHEFRIPERAALVLPLLGSVPSPIGRSLDDLALDLSRRFEDGWLRQAPVRLELVSRLPERVAVLGAVRTPQAFILPESTATTALMAVAECGGFTEEADRRNARILRRDASAEGGMSLLALAPEDSLDALRNDPVLSDGDLILVPRLDRVFITGRVTRSGAITLPGDHRLTVSQAISLAGGLTEFARSSRVLVLRSGRVITVDVGAVLAGGAAGDDPTLEAGDTIFVPESRF